MEEIKTPDRTVSAKRPVPVFGLPSCPECEVIMTTGIREYGIIQLVCRNCGHTEYKVVREASEEFTKGMTALKHENVWASKVWAKRRKILTEALVFGTGICIISFTLHNIAPAVSLVVAWVSRWI